MDKLKAIIKREYLIRVRSKGFLFGTIASPLLLILYMTVPMLMVKLSSHQTHQLAIVDEFGDEQLYRTIEQLLTRNNDNQREAEKQGEADRYVLRREVAVTPEESAAKQKLLNEQLGNSQLSAYVVLPKDALNKGHFPYFAKNVGDLSTKGRVSDAISEAVVARRMAQAGMDANRVNDLSREVLLDTINREGQREEGQTFFLTFGLIMAIYVSILVYGITVMRGVIEEKQWRIIEVLLSSVKPVQLMIGKLVGIGLVGLTQFAVWALTGSLVTLVGSMPLLKLTNTPIPNFSPMLMFFFVLYFVLGYFLYATLYAIVGAIVSNEEDGQQMQIPVTMTIMIPIMLSVLVMQDPNSTTSTVLSFVPFFSPILMFMRISFQTPPAWQILLSIVLMLVTISAMIWLAAKIYRVGVLMYGKRPSLPEVARWLKYS
jgi:ABC-2 type transport system permease protein